MHRRVSRTVLANFIRHADTHNRIFEENECWRQYESQNPGISACSKDSAPRRENDEASRTCKNSHEDVRSSSDTSLGSSQTTRFCKMVAHMDEDVKQRSYEGRDERTMEGGTFWMKELFNAKAADPDRWGHSGYKELYPEDFNEDCDKSKPGRLSPYPAGTDDQRHKRKSKQKKRKKKRHKLEEDEDEESSDKTKAKRRKVKDESHHSTDVNKHRRKKPKKDKSSSLATHEKHKKKKSKKKKRLL